MWQKQASKHLIAQYFWQTWTQFETLLRSLLKL